jgi:hypothetical protein
VVEGTTEGANNIIPVTAWAIPMDRDPSYTALAFLYRVEDDGALRFIRSEAMGCSSPDGYFMKERSEQEN